MDTQQPTLPPNMNALPEDKTTAIIAYITIIGFIIAIILNGQKKTALGTFHLRQMFGIVLVSFASSFLFFIPILGWLSMVALGIINFIMWIMGLIAAANGEMKPAPILGEKYQEWFKTVFN